MSAIIVNQSVSPAASAMSLTGLIRSDTDAAPAGVSLPIAMTFSGGFWTCTFSDTAPPPTYTGTFTVTIGSLTYPPFSDTIPGGGGAVGYYSTQAKISSKGRADSDSWSQINNDESGPSQQGYQSAIDSIDAVIDAEVRDAGFQCPVPLNSLDFKIISEIAVKMCLTELYRFPRGIRDSDKVGGQLGAAYDMELSRLRKMLRRPMGIDCPRLASPAVRAANPQQAAAAQGGYSPVRPAVPSIRPWWGIGGWRW